MFIRVFIIALFGLSSTIGGAADLPKEVRQQLQTQVDRSFSEKFSVVTPNIARTSATNLDAIETGLKTRMGAPLFAALLRKAEPAVREARSKISIQSETSVKSAIAILEDGALLGLDELIRRKKVPLEAKAGASTRFFVDGVIGQQDTVFLALKPNDIPGSASSMIEWSFGDAKFVFAESVLERGYFTPYTFDSSPESLHLVENDATQPERLQQAIALYRQVVFSGKDAYLRLLKLSAAQMLFERDRTEVPFKAIQETQDAFYRRNTALAEEVSLQKLPQDEIIRRLNSPIDGGPLCPLFQFFAQPCPKAVSSNLFEGVRRSQSMRVDGELGETMRLLGAYTTFPISAGDLSVSLAYLWGFWELKIPTRLPLDDLKAVEIAHRNKDSTPEQIAKLETAIEAFARMRGKKMVRTESFDEKEYRHAQILTPSIDREQFRRIRYEWGL